MARLIESVIGHEREIYSLQGLIERKKWPHATMFVGPSGIGKKKVALAFAQALICEEAELACGVCGPCLRVEKQQSESLVIIGPDTELARPIIKVEKIRDLLSSLSLANLGLARVVIIDQAHLMNPQAANALLKTLEEPAEGLYFILLAADVHQFLPTIRSRVQAVRFTALKHEEIIKIKPGLPDWTYRSSRGQVDRLDSLSSPEGAAKREEAFGFLEQFFEDPDFLKDKNWRDSVKDRAWALFSVHCWMQMIRDAAVLKSQAQKFILNTDQTERLKAIYAAPVRRLSWFSKQLIEVEKGINANADTVLLFEDLWIRYARVD